MPTSITDRGHEHVRAPLGEGGHGLLLGARAHLPVEEHDLEVGELGAVQPLVLGGGRARGERLGLLHQRAHDEGLAAGPKLLADALVGPRPLALAARHVGLHRLAAGRQLAQDSRVEIGVDGEREGARDRRGRQVQHVRLQAFRGLAVECRALTNAEAVLLVHDRDRQAVEGHVLLDQRVGPDDQRELAGGQLGQHVGAPRPRGRARQQRRGHRLPTEQALDRGEVLLRQRLGRCHQRGLHPVLDGAQHGGQRHDRLARPHLAHEQPLHRTLVGEIVEYLLDGAGLVAGRLERQALAQPAIGQIQRAVEGRRGRRGLANGAPAQERELQQQQLVEGQPPAPAGRVARGLGEVHGAEGRGAARQSLARAQARRQRLEDVGELVTVLAHERQDLRGGDPLRRRVVRDRVGAGDGVRGRCVALHAERVAAPVLAVQDQPRPGRVLALEPRLVEEGRLHRARGVGHRGLHERAHPAPAHRAAADIAHLHHDGRRLSRRERGHRAGLATVVRQVREQVADGLEPQRRGPPRGGRGSDPQRLGQARRARPSHRRAAQRVVVERVDGAERGEAGAGGGYAGHRGR